MTTRENRGTLLILTVVMMVIIGGMVFTMFTISMAGSRREEGRDTKFKSLEIAEAGLDMAVNELRKATDKVDNDSNGVVDDGVLAVDVFGRADANSIEGRLGRIGTLSWTTGGDTVLANGYPDFGEPGVTPAAFSGGELIAYSVFSEADGRDNDGDGTVDEDDEAGAVMLFALGRYRGIVSMVQWNGIFTEKLGPPNPPTWNPNAAIATGGTLIATGTSDVYGSHGSVHANNHLTLKGTSYIQKNATACNGVDGIGPASGGGKPKGVGGIIDGAAAAIDIPDVRPESFRALADYQFLANGTVRLKDGTIVTSNPYKGWGYAGGQWTSSSSVSGIVFVEGSVAMPDCSGTDVPFTLIATGNIHATKFGDYKPALGNLFLVAGGDIRFNGNAQMMHPGIILAREQIHFNGTADLLGAVMAADLDNKYSEVEANFINGTMSITYDGNLLNTDIPVVSPSNKFILDPNFAAYEER